MGHRIFPVVGWAERGGYSAAARQLACRGSTSPGAPGPAWSSRSSAGSGRRPRPAGCAPLPAPGRRAHRHRRRRSTASRARCSSRARGRAAGPARRDAAGDVRAARAGGDRRLRRHRRQPRPGPRSLARRGSAPPPDDLLSGVPAHVDGRMIGITETAGGAVINRDRMWHYVEGIANWDPVWPLHGIRILPGPVLAVARRHRTPAAGAAVSRLRHAGHARAPAAHRLRPLLVHPHQQDHRARSSRCPARSRTPT